MDPESAESPGYARIISCAVVAEELEKELGETIPNAVVEAQRRFVKEGFYSIDEISNEEAFRAQLALRGLGNLREMEIAATGLHMRIGNAAGHLIIAGLAQGLFDMAFDVDSHVEWEVCSPSLPLYSLPLSVSMASTAIPSPAKKGRTRSFSMSAAVTAIFAVYSLAKATDE
jgi:hypothetical protein